ncbi:MAG: monovalent cation/H(+) antiporter subunit G [Campylobacterales bacterium]|nr:monovalent cation/H(+) antiporter subunit G [Campylobacterales bacterium]
MFERLGLVLMGIGALFLLLSALGLWRMPDTLSRMHASTKASTLGILLVVLGAVCHTPELWFKLGLLGLFVLLTNPLSASILGHSSYRKEGFYSPDHIDALKEESL